MSTTFVLQPGSSDGEDLTIFNKSATTNHLIYEWLAMGEHNALSTYIYRILIRFPTLATGGVPKNRTVLSATLSLYLYDDSCSYSRSYSFFRLKRAYVPAQATWNSYQTGSAWHHAGLYTAYASDDYDKTALATTTLGASEADGWKEWDLDTDVVFQMINGYYQNNGFFGMCNAEFNDLYDFRSSRYSNATLHPKLTVEVEDYVGGAIML